MFTNCMKNLVEKIRTLKQMERERTRRMQKNIDEHKEKEQAELLKDEKPKYYHQIPKKEENKKLWSPRKWPYPIWERTFL